MVMDLNEIKKISEIFENFAQPIATVIAAVLAYKAVIITSKNTKKRKK